MFSSYLKKKTWKQQCSQSVVMLWKHLQITFINFFIYLFNLSWIVAFLSIYTTSLSVYYLRKYPSYDFHKMCYFINENGTSVVFLILLYYRVFSFYMHINWKFLLYDVTYIVRFICHIKQYLNTKKYKCFLRNKNGCRKIVNLFAIYVYRSFIGINRGNV